ncbi:hypothetical protein LJC49_10645 [Ruminococcaceae bacterium OttesenSCG-928-I18]|nr:hypothetical protein [Ruminococcaceae bacterium OttesenSCG-928-I18]
MGLFSNLFGGSSSAITEEEREEFQKIVAMVKSGYDLAVISKMTFGTEDPKPAKAVRDAYHNVKAVYGAKGTSVIYDMCLKEDPSMKDFLKDNWK